MIEFLFGVAIIVAIVLGAILFFHVLKTNNKGDRS